MDTNNKFFNEIAAVLEKLYGEKPPLKVIAAYAVLGTSLEIEDAKKIVYKIGKACEENYDFALAAITSVGQLFEELMERGKKIDELQKQVEQLKEQRHGK